MPPDITECHLCPLTQSMPSILKPQRKDLEILSPKIMKFDKNNIFLNDLYNELSKHFDINFNEVKKSFDYAEKITEKEYDYGCIPGAAVWKKNKPSPIFEARIRKALELYRKNYYKKIILTGGNAPGEISEAEAAQKYLVNLGVNKKDIILEKETSTTSEQIKYLKKYFSNKKILIVSDGFHLSRITQIAKFFNLKVEGVSSDYTMTLEKAIYYRTRETVALLMFWLFAI